MKGRWARDFLNLFVALSVLAGVFGFYLLTGPEDLAWMEGALYQRRVASNELGEGPWDRPLFVVLSQPFLLLPWGELARRANWASAAFGAGACLFVYLLIRLLLQMAPQFIARRVGILAAISLGVSHTFWIRAVTPGPEPLDALLLAATLYFLIRFANLGGAVHLYLAMAILGLSLSNNLLFVFLVPIVFLFVRFVEPPLLKEIGKVRFRGLLVFAAGASLALAVTATGWLATGFRLPEEQQSWLRFWTHMHLSWDAPLKRSLERFGALLLLNFPPWTVLVGLVGLWELFRRQKYVFWLVFPLFLTYGSLVVTLDLARPVPAYLPAWVLLSVAVGFGWWRLLSSGSWQGFAVALVLSASPLALYRYGPGVARELRMELRAEALFDAPSELPLDALAFQINPDRRGLPEARDFARAALSALPEGSTVLSTSRTGELMVAPVRYLVEVEDLANGNVTFATLPTESARARLASLSSSSGPVFAMGLHPPHPAVTESLTTHRFLAEGNWFRWVPRESVADRVLTDRPLPGDDGDLDDADLLGRWYGYAAPQGYPLTLRVEGGPGALTGAAVVNENGSRPWRGAFTRLSSTVGTVLGSVEYGEPGTDQLHVHIDATQKGNRLEGTWTVYELPELSGTFVAWKQPPGAPEAKSSGERSGRELPLDRLEGDRFREKGMGR